MPRCLLISNRLPVSFNEKTQEFIPSSGGLVSAIRGLDPRVIGYDFEWLGILTDDINEDHRSQITKIQANDLRCHPIIIPKDVYAQYYNNFCNNVLWPLFHYEHSLVRHSEHGWSHYLLVNQLVASEIAKEAQPNETVWIHDFHFMMVPHFLKSERPDLKIGFFLHIPFPSSEIFRELPQRKEILESLIQCDLVGFHDLSYLNHFKTSISRILNLSPIQYSDRKWGVYPISIDTDYFASLTKNPKTKDYVKQYQETKKSMKWILGVDRLDYIKGLLLKLQSFQLFLKKFPHEVGKVQMVQVVIPSREDVPEYQELKSKVEQLVSSINGEFGSPTYMPVYYLYHSVNSQELSALYQLSEVMHISSQRDGMNLVSLEYVVSQTELHPGSLLLSEFTGAHSTLSYAISINPWNVDETAQKIQEALQQDPERQRREMMSMKNFLHRYTSSDWAKFFLRDLHKDYQYKNPSQVISQDGSFQWMEGLRGKKVLFFCDLDGTLAPISPYPSQVRLQAKTQKLLRLISSNPNFQFVIVSGRDQSFLEEQFIKNDYRFPIAACHGAYSYTPDTGEWTNLIPHDSTKWKDTVIDILKLYTSRTPESFIEDKGHAVTWHYRNSPSDFADFLANKLFIELEEALTSLPAQVSKGKKVIEVKSLHANKGIFVQQWIERQYFSPDVVVALGDDTTDEDMFEYLQGQKEFRPYCIKVGSEKTSASYFIRDQKNVNQFLASFIQSL